MTPASGLIDMQTTLPRPPNIVLLMADQLTAFALATYGNQVCRTPNLDRLAARGTVFENAWCGAPLCAPARFALLSGQLPSRIGAYDNAAEFAASVPTVAYALSGLGYRTSLIGKMHFVGPDQLHGYQQRLTTDIYPADFGWTPDWRQSIPFGPAGMSMRSVVEAGVCSRSLQFDYDEEVAHCAEQHLFDLARRRDPQPFFLTVSFTHPHNPYVTTREYWDRYASAAIDEPRVPPIAFDQRDPHAKRLYHLFRQDEHVVTPADVRNARHAYYANVSYIDDKIGRLLSLLDELKLSDDTVVIFTADHGDMLGERGLWYKYTLHEPALRVPLIVAMPRDNTAPRRCSEPVSHLDLLPTLLELGAGNAQTDLPERTDGTSLVPLIAGQVVEPRTVHAEFTSEGAVAPMVAVRRGSHKLILCPADPPQLFDVHQDPQELHNLAGQLSHSAVEAELRDAAAQTWNLPQLHQEVLASQARRRWIQDRRLGGHYPGWDHQPVADASQRFVRSGGQSSPTMVKGLARYPFVPAKPLDHPRVPSAPAVVHPTPATDTAS